MKVSILIVLSLLSGIFLPLGSAPIAPAENPPRLYIKSETPQSDYIEIIYEVTFSGFVELHLFNPDGKKIWIKGQVTDRTGVDKIRIPRQPLEPGKRYSYILKYKGKDYSGRFSG